MPFLYHMTLQKTGAIVQAVHGSFSAPKTQEIVVSRGTAIELLRPDSEGRINSVCFTEVFGFVRKLVPFRMAGGSIDFLAVSSDSGRIVILEYKSETGQFEKIHQETYGKTGVRRIVPGEYLAADPKGRALMIGAVEKCKFVYVLNRDADQRMSISSPLEAHKSFQICHAMCGVDVGFENPIFATIEQIYNDDKYKNNNPPAKGLSFWEMDLGLNHVIKKCTLPVPITAHMLIPVNGGTQGVDAVSGVLVCCANHVIYKKPEHPDIVCAYPRRLDMSQDAGLIIVSYASHRTRDYAFFLLQSEYGDLYKLELVTQEGSVKELVCRYFDTIPVCNSLCVLRTGYLFAAAEFGNHYCYQFKRITPDPSDAMCSSLHPQGKDAIVIFRPRSPQNIVVADEITSCNPILDARVMDALGEGHPQIYALCGRGPRSTLRIIQHGAAVEQLADNELPGKSKNVWTVKNSQMAQFDTYMVVSFSDSTLVLSIGETVEEVTDSHFVITAPTIHVQLLYDDSIVQVYETGIRQIQKRRMNEWRCPAGKKIVCAGSNERQVAIALNGGEVLYFEIDDTMTLVDVARKELGFDANCIFIQPLVGGRSRAQFMAVGGMDNTVRILSMDKQLKQVAVQALGQALPESVCIVNSKDNTSTASKDVLVLNIGLETGILVKAVIDEVTGQLSDFRQRYLGPRPLKLYPVTVEVNDAPQSAMMALSVKPWLTYLHQGKYMIVPLKYDKLESVSTFSSQQCPDGFVAICGKALRIFRCPKLGHVFNEAVVPLSFTPRQVASLTATILGANQTESEQQCMLAIVEADHNAYDLATRSEIAAGLKQVAIGGEKPEEAEAPEAPVEDEDDDDEMDMDIEADDGDIVDQKPIELDSMDREVGTYKAGAGRWGSCIRIVNPVSARTTAIVPMPPNEAALSCTVCRFLEFEAACLVVATSVGMTYNPKTTPFSSLKVYAYNAQFQLTLLHSTPLDDQPMSMCPWNGRLLVSVGNKIRIYALGKKKLLKKCEYRNLPSPIVWLRVVGDRIFAGDLCESIHVLKYREQDNVLHVLADDKTPSWVTTGEVLDYHTVIAADKFDGIRVLRVPQDAQDDEVGDNTGLKLKGDTAYLTGQCHKLEHINHFHVGETIMSLQKCSITPGGVESVLYTTVMGTIGTFLPLTTKEELDFFQHLELVLRAEMPGLCGRDALTFRSYYFPVKAVIDGDLCEMFGVATPAKQRDIAQQMGKTVPDILRRLEAMRNRVL